MGFHVIIDIIGSAVIGGILLVTLLNMKAANTENTFKYSGNQRLQENLINLIEIIDNDFKQIGYAYDSTYTNPIRLATKNRIKFYTNIKPNAVNNPDGLRDEIEYYFNGADNNTANPGDTLLKRIVTTADPNFNQSGAITNLNLGLVRFNLTYRDINGALLTLTSSSTQVDINRIYSIQMDITIQSTSVYYRTGAESTDQYSKESVRWRRKFYAFKSRNNR